MINTNRIVPVEKVDLLSLYGLILKQDTTNNSTLTKLVSKSVDGDFQITSGSAPLIADQPVKSCDIDVTASSVSACTLYFVADYDYKGFSKDGTAVETEGVDVVADGVTLYKAVLSSGDITISKIGF